MAQQVEIWLIDEALARQDGIETYHRLLGCDRDCPCGVGTADWRLASEVPADWAF